MSDHDGEGVLHSIACIVDEWCWVLSDEQKDGLKAALYQREDLIGDSLRELGRRFGLYPEIVAHCLTNEVYLGTPTDEVTRSHINAQFLALMERLRNEQNNG